MKYRILGPVEICGSDGVFLIPGRPKQRQLLAALLLAANMPVTVSHLIDSLWEDSPPGSSRGILKTYVWGLRRLLSPDDPAAAPIETVGGGYRITVASDELDLLVFKRLAGEGLRALRSGDLYAAESLLDQASQLWKGIPLQCVPLSRALADAATWLEEERLDTFEHWVDAQLRLGRSGAAMGPLHSWLRSNPMRERLCSQLMLALYRGGRQTDALRAFQGLRRRLIEELGIEPSLPVQRLHQRILAGDQGLFDLATPDPFSNSSLHIDHHSRRDAAR